MSSQYPGTIQTFTNPSGTSVVTSPDHAGLHSDLADTSEAVQAVLGTTAGTAVLMSFADGEFSMREDSGGTASGTPAFDNIKIGTATPVTNVLDDDAMTADSAVSLVTQQSVKAYVDTNTQTSCCRVYDASVQAIDNTTATVIDWDSEVFDVGTLHDPSTNNSRITFDATGKWLVVAQLAWNSNATGDRFVQIFNGANSLGLTRESANASDVHIQQVSAIISGTAGSYVVCRGYQSSGGTLNVRAGVADSFFSAHRLS